MHNKPHTLESRKLISVKTKEAMSRPEVFKKLSLIRTNKNKPSNIELEKVCLQCHSVFTRKKRSGWKLWGKRKFCSKKCQGIWIGINQTGERNHNFGKKASKETKIKQSESHRGEKAYNFKDGKSRDKHGGYEYKEWRSSVFMRDNWTCQTCRIRGCYLEAHHIKSWAKYPNLRYDIMNGVTLCLGCHKLTDSYGGKKYD